MGSVMGVCARKVRVGALAWLFVASTVVASACSPSAAAGCPEPKASATCTRVLFIGNSYTYVNDLPTVFAELARSGGHRVETSMVAAGGLTLAQHAASPQTGAALKSSAPDVVVLQEQSQVPASAAARFSQMYPAAHSLVAEIETAGARPILFLTWAHRDGWPEGGLADFRAMQASIDDGYLELARQLGVPVAPVGYAWEAVRARAPGLALWQDDGSHPSATGTYLAACVFYAAIIRESPVGLKWRGALAEADASLLQSVAAGTVLADAGRWGLPPGS
jgi:hypothetical protein